MPTLRQRLEYLVFRTFVCIVQAFSPRMCERMAQSAGWFVHNVLPRRLTRFDVAQANLRAAFGDRCDEARTEALIGRMWVHLFRLVAEMIHLPRRLRLDNINELIVFRNKSEVVRALCSGRPVLLVSGHFGNWEMAISIFGLFGFRMGLVARELDNPYLNQWFLQFRKYTGHRPIPKMGGGGTMVALLERGGSLAMLGDQDAGSCGQFVDFFGRRASTHKSIGILALEYEALICVGYARRLENERLSNGWPRFELGCEEVIDSREFTSAEALQEITQRFTAALERVVRRSPEQYFWVHRRWKSVPRSRIERARRRKAG